MIPTKGVSNHPFLSTNTPPAPPRFFFFLCSCFSFCFYPHPAVLPLIFHKVTVLCICSNIRICYRTYSHARTPHISPPSPSLPYTFSHTTHRSSLHFFLHTSDPYMHTQSLLLVVLPHPLAVLAFCLISTGIFVNLLELIASSPLFILEYSVMMGSIFEIDLELG